MRKITVGFPIISSKEWMGGYNYLLNLLSALNRYEAKTIQPVLFYGDDSLEEDIEPFRKIANLTLSQNKAFDKNQRNIGTLQAVLLGRNLLAKKAFEKEKIDIAFESANFFGWLIRQKSLAWLPDFQHRQIPHLFSKAAWWKRDIGFNIQILAKRHILLSSNSALADCERFYNVSPHKLHVLKFPTLINQETLEENNYHIKQNYKIPHHFFYISNQFWTHKNHDIVIDALAILKSNNVIPTVVCTGSTNDPRAPDHFKKLQIKIKNNKLEKNFKILGLIPRSHATTLLRSCVAMINPSFFEGWNSSVEEAKAFNVPMLLSDIPVHHEQAENSAHYFAPNDAQTLADAIENMMSCTAPQVLRQPAQSADSLEKDFAARFSQIAHGIMVSNQ